MTRSAQIVNTSNWDGEDLEVISVTETGVQKQVIKPGETSYLPVYHEDKPVTVVAIPRTSKTPEPFTDDDGKQITPQLSIGFK